MKKLSFILLVSALIPSVALGEMFPPDDNAEPQFRLSDDYRRAKRPRRYGERDEKGNPISERERQRRSVEAYLDSARAERGNSRSYRGRSRRPRAYEQQTDVRRRRPRVNYEAGQTEAPERYYAQPDSFAYEPRQYQRSYQDEPAQPGYQAPPRTYRNYDEANEAPPESYAEDRRTLNYQSPFSARPAPSPFEREERNDSRENLLKVKRWAQEPDRKVASLDRRGNPLSTEEDLERDANAPKPWAVKLGLVGGLSSAVNSNASTQTNRESLALGDNFYLGAQADVSAYQYFGAEGDFYYGIAPPITVIENSGESVQSLQQWGFMADAKVQAPIPMDGGMSLTPKLGLGFGALGMNEVQETDSATNEALIQTSGMYFMAGVDVQINDKISLGVDYAASLGATATVDSTLVQAPTETEGSFNRLRIGAYWKLTNVLGIGGQFITRQISVGGADSAGGSESLTQFLGVLQIHL